MTLGRGVDAVGLVEVGNARHAVEQERDQLGVHAVRDRREDGAEGVDVALLAGLLITNSALLGATMLLYRLVDEEWGAAIAGRTVWYLLIFPTAFFGSAIYTESLFLFCTIGSLYFARQGYWESATLLGIGATLTRFVGILVAPMLLLD